jgi:hypothetical protein
MLVSAGLAGMFGGFASAADKKLRAGYDADGNSYLGTRREAQAAVSDARTANILFAVTGAAAAVTGLFIYWDITDAQPPVKVSGALTPQGVAVTLGGAF